MSRGQLEFQTGMGVPPAEDINRVQTNVKYDFVYVDEESFEKYKPSSFKQLVDGFREYKKKM